MDVDPTAWVSMADHLGAAYLRYAFTKGTDQEVDFLIGALGLRPGDRVLDVGCGPGRHAHALARRGIRVHGVDISPRFVALARQSATDLATFEVADARQLDVDGRFDAVLSLCQGGFGLLGEDDQEVLRRMARAARRGGAVCATAPSAYFVVRFLEAGDRFDPDTGVNHETATVRNEGGEEARFDLWSSCFTPRELRLLGRAAGLTVEHVWSVGPGRYGAEPPNLDLPELLLVGRRPR